MGRHGAAFLLTGFAVMRLAGGGRAESPAAARFKVVGRSCYGGTLAYWQLGNLNDAMRVLQLKEPVVLRYSLVYQNVQSSTGSIVMAE